MSDTENPDSTPSSSTPSSSTPSSSTPSSSTPSSSTPSSSTPSSSIPSGTTPSSTEEIQADIEQTRAELAHTVDQVVDKLNVKSQVGDKAESVKQAAAARAGQAKAAAPAPVQRALDTVGAKAGPVAQKVNATTAPNRGKIAAGMAAGVLVLVIVRRVRARPSS